MAIEKPTAAAGTILGGGSISLTGTEFWIKTKTGSFDFFSPDFDNTGDGDSEPDMINNGLIYGDYAVSGVMIANKHVGIADLVSANNPVVAMTFALGGTRTFTLTVLVKRIRVEFDYRAPWVGVRLILRNTTTAPAENAEV